MYILQWFLIFLCFIMFVCVLFEATIVDEFYVTNCLNM